MFAYSRSSIRICTGEDSLSCASFTSVTTSIAPSEGRSYEPSIDIPKFLLRLSGSHNVVLSEDFGIISLLLLVGVLDDIRRGRRRT